MQKVNQQTQIQTLRPDKAGKTTPQTKKKKDKQSQQHLTT